MTSTEVAASTRQRGRRLGRAAGYALLTAVVLFGVGFLVRSRWDPLMSLDDRVIGALTSVTRSTPGLRDALILWQEATRPVLLHVAGTALCLWVWLARGMRTRAWWGFATLMVSWAVGLGAKYVFQRARPIVEDPVSEAPGYSFPSGHALNSAAFTAVVIILLWPIVTHLVARGVLIAVGAVVVVFTALDRTFLGVHYPSDVTVGVLTGVGLVLASYAGYSNWTPSDAETAHDPDLHPDAGADPDVVDDRHASR